MLAVGDDDGAGAATAGHVNGAPLVLGVLDEALDGGGIRADQGDHTVNGYHVSKADVDKFHMCILLGKGPALCARTIIIQNILYSKKIFCQCREEISRKIARIFQKNYKNPLQSSAI